MGGPAWSLRPDEAQIAMARKKDWHLVAYDVRDPARLRRVAKHLKGYGSRIQYSLFRCRLNPRQVERLCWELKRIMAEDDDLLVVRLCAECVARLKGTEQRAAWMEEESRYEIL